MQLSLAQLSFSGTLLLLTTSNLLLWEHVSSSPSSRLSTGNLYQRVVELSHYTHDLASKVFTDFNMMFGRSVWKQGQMISACHTAAIPTPENREQVHQTKSEDLLKVTISILQAWEDPVKHMATVVAGLQGAPDVMISRTKELGERMLGLLEGLKIVLSRIQPGAVDIENSFWYGWSDLQSSDEDTRNIALYTLGRCVRRDTHKVDNFLKVLKCRDVHNNNC
ncbi:prolactin-3B1-like [Microtus ochrogaster]|uniref:Prolactin-3B1-like n=1 Tax=Microtus ochrogaster TaxID=79684 RepID=A0ABM0KY03_MICOH|nr:prolactin-3B1-like [Microtus ochrogaster]